MVLRKTGCVVVCALLLAGCSQSEYRAERAHDSPVLADQTTVRGPDGERLTLVKPPDVTLRRGKAESVVVQLRRRNIGDQVQVTVSNLPRGVEAVDAPRATASDRAEIVLRAAEDADLVGNHEALVTAEGPDDIRATETLKVSVRDR